MHARLGFEAADSAFEADHWSPEWGIQYHCRVAKLALVWDTSRLPVMYLWLWFDTQHKCVPIAQLD